MTLLFHEPGSTDGWLRRRDPHWKLVAMASASLAAVLLTRPGPALAFLCCGLILALSTKVAIRRLGARIGPVALMLTCFFAWSLFFPRPNDTTMSIAGVVVSRDRGVGFVVLLAKTSAMLSFVVALLETTPMQELGQAAASLGAPRLLVQLMLLTHRYVFVLAEEFARTRLAVRVRGFRSRMNHHTYHTIGHIAGTLLVRGHERADRVHHAMACRGHDGVFRSLRKGTTRPMDVVFFLAIASLSLGVLLWDGRLFPS